jgi:ribosomal protein S18 acetylase RimI-like enzyme
MRRTECSAPLAEGSTLSAEASLHIRPMIDADCSRVSEILRACFTWLGEREGFNTRQLEYLLGERSSEDTVRKEALTRPHIVACLGDDLVGLAVVNGNELARLYVHPDFHRHGIGKQLFETVQHMIKSAGFSEMRVGALAPSAADFYIAMGMTITGKVAWEPEIFGEREVTILTKPLSGR